MMYMLIKILFYKTVDVGKTSALCYRLLKKYIVTLLLDILLVAWV